MPTVFRTKENQDFMSSKFALRKIILKKIDYCSFYGYDAKTEINQINKRYLTKALILLRIKIRAGVAKLVYAPDSKSGEIHFSCRFESDLRH